MIAQAAVELISIETGPEARLRVLPSLREWETRTFEGVTLSPADRALVTRMADDRQGRIQIDELRDGLRVRARSWVGVVRLETIEIRIAPKLAGDQLGLVRLLELTHGVEGLNRLDTEADIRVAGDSLLDLVALLFAQATEQVIRRGLIADYLEQEEALPVVRGRILADRQILERFGQLDRIICRFDELERDVDENRLLVAAIRMALRCVKSSNVHRRLARLRAVLEPICDMSDFDLRAVRRDIFYNRLNEHYRTAHFLGCLLLDGLGIEDLLSGGPTRSFAFLLDMNTLFERFIEKLVAAALSSDQYRVDTQVVHSSIIWDALMEKPYSRVIPDLVVESRGSSGQRLAIDAKYKLYDDRRVGQGDIYQTFLYAYALGSRTGGRVPTSLLLYPATSSEKRHHLRIRSAYSSREAQIIGMGIRIPEALDELERGGEGEICAELAAHVHDALAGSAASGDNDQ